MPIHTGAEFALVEANKVQDVPFIPGQMIIQDDGSIFYDKAQGNNSSEHRLSVGTSTYTNNNPTSISVGGIPVGKTFDQVPITDVLNQLLYPYLQPTIRGLTLTRSPTTTILEIGSSCTYGSLKVTISRGSDPLQYVIIRDLTDTSKFKELSEEEIQNINSSANEFTLLWDFDDYIGNDENGPHKYEVEVKDSQSSYTKRYSPSGPTFVYPYYYGSVNLISDIDSDTISAMSKLVESKGNKEISYTANNQFIVFAFPSSYGNLTKITDANNFDVTGTFIKLTKEVNGVEYNVYHSSDSSTVENFNITFTY